MPFLWSDNATHIQSLFRPWQPTDQYSERELAVAESAAGLRFPTTLRSFYRDWGRHQGLAQGGNDLLLPLNDTFVRSDGLVFCQENQAVMYWGIQRGSIEMSDPPVSYADTLDWDDKLHRPILGVWRPSHERTSDFLDAFTYAQAFGGAVCVGRTREPADERREMLLHQHWRQIDVRSVPWGLYPNTYPRHWPLWVRDRQAIWQTEKFLVAAGSQEDFDEIAHKLDVTWELG